MAVESECRKRAVKADLDYGVPVKITKSEAGNITIMEGTFRLRSAALELKAIVTA